MNKYILYIMLVLMLLLSACKETPNELIVQNKNDGELEAILSQDDIIVQPENNTTIDEDRLIKKIDYNSVDDFSCDINLSDNGKLYGSAELMSPDRENHPIIKYKRREFTNQEIEYITNYLSNGSELYDYDIEMTKEQIDKIILDLKCKLSNPEMLEDELGEPDDEYVPDIDQIKKNYEDSVDYWIQEREKAPDKMELHQIVAKLNKHGYLQAKTFFSDANLANIKIAHITNRPKDMPNSCLGITYSVIGKNGDDELSFELRHLEHRGDIVDRNDSFTLKPVEEYETYMRTTPEEAVNTAKSVFAELGAGGDIKVSDVFLLKIPDSEMYFGKETYCYAIELKRYVNNMPIILQSSGMEGRDVEFNDAYNIEMPREEMYIYMRRRYCSIEMD